MCSTETTRLQTICIHWAPDYILWKLTTSHHAILCKHKVNHTNTLVEKKVSTHAYTNTQTYTAINSSQYLSIIITQAIQY